MAYRIYKSEGGQGGKRGHSGMVHREKTEVIKVHAKHLRRKQARDIVRKALRDPESE